jgi:hypothetical protein
MKDLQRAKALVEDIRGMHGYENIGRAQHDILGRKLVKAVDALEEIYSHCVKLQEKLKPPKKEKTWECDEEWKEVKK